MDPDIRSNLTCHIKKASIDESRVVAVKAKDVKSKNYSYSSR